MSTTEEQANTAVIEQVFAAFATGDVPAIMAQLTDDVCFVAHLDPVVPWFGEWSGKDSVGNYFQALGGSIEVLAHPVTQLVAQGDTVVALGDVTFRGRVSGKESSSSWAYVWKLRDGKVCRFEQFNDQGLEAPFS